MVSRWLFAGLVGAVAVQRLFELRRSRRHAARLRCRGGMEVAPEQMKWLVAVHTGWLVAMPLEVFIFGRRLRWAMAGPALLGFLGGQLLRAAAMRALGERWTVTIMVIPGEPAVERGVFRYLRHPNYLGVMLELAALPLVHGAWMTSIAFSALDGVVLRRRIRAEEAALAATSDYARRLAPRPRFVPLPRRGGEVSGARAGLP